MNKYERVYTQIQYEGARNLEIISKKVLDEIQEKTNSYFVINGSNYITKILSLLQSKYKSQIIPILKKYNYNLHSELQFIIANICYHPEVMGNFITYPSIKDISKIQHGYNLDTVYGDVKLYIANLCNKDLAKYTYYAYCHFDCEKFLKDYTDVSASTCLIDDPFSKKHYHSFINYDKYIIDLSHNACMTKEDYYKIFVPQVINTVTSEEIFDEEKRINSKENLGEQYELLLRLALDKQVE